MVPSCRARLAFHDALRHGVEGPTHLPSGTHFDRMVRWVTQEETEAFLRDFGTGVENPMFEPPGVVREDLEEYNPWPSFL